MAIVVLTGFMGTGKTSIGAALAARLGRPFVDTDAVIERREGRPISAIFAAEGETYFRAAERQVIAEAALQSEAVIATGGGAIVDPANLAALRAAAPIVCLTARPEVILHRTGGGGDRPLLAGAEPAARVAALLAERAPAYAQADLTIDTSDRPLETVVGEIERFLAGRQGGGAATVMVDLGARSYPICIGARTLDGLGARLRQLQIGHRVAVITNPVVAPLHGDALVASLTAAGFAPTVIEVPDGEEHKNLAWLTFLYDRLVDAKLDRESAVIALGGGVIGDLAGFTAATFQRGVPLVQVPTTLLAQVDSSVGGKTAVNHPAGKNYIGAFHQPRLVWIDVHTLRTLSRRQVQAGMAEVIKHGAVLGAPLFALLEAKMDRVLALDETLLIEVVRQNCAIKAAVVGEDERESGYRAVLNFGHTVGHAVEMLTDYRRYLHGEAVAIGMAFAARLSAARGACAPAVADRVVALLRRAGLPTELPEELVGPHLALAIGADKKVAGGKVKFVLIEDIGRARFEPLSSDEVLAHAEETLEA